MKVDSYRSVRQPGKFIFVPSGTDITDKGIGITDPDFSSVSVDKKDIDIAPSMIGVDPAALEQGIAEKGYYIDGVKVSVSVQIIEQKKRK
ncbi:hypothetical protein H0I69_15330 [Yersinia enterocolitica]|uniref:hypothetical protein n=1 Tax=Yersinia enterocolitica TaxID=630 RepID=UPI001CA53DCF|nr:hypothetical protein [Yersinia enterocolitica]MBW5869165.1 hypothetical protein [Yersinia enterocolitica]